MNINDLKPAGSFAQNYGAKMLVYGPPGVGKTPLISTAPRPVLLLVEPGAMSLKGCNVQTCEAHTVEAIDDFFKWFLESKESDNFDTLGIDSISQIAEIHLKAELKRNKDGRKAYGEMSRKVCEIADNLYFRRYKHIYLIAKQSQTDLNGISFKTPYFPGQDLNVKIPHQFDIIMQLAKRNVPGIQKPTAAFLTCESFEALARDRSGKLAELEPPDLNYIISKIMN